MELVCGHSCEKFYFVKLSNIYKKRGKFTKDTENKNRGQNARFCSKIFVEFLENMILLFAKKTDFVVKIFLKR